MFLAEKGGLIRIAVRRFSPLRGALRASKTLTRFVERGSHPYPLLVNQNGPIKGPFWFAGGEGVRLHRIPENPVRSTHSFSTNDY